MKTAAARVLTIVAAIALLIAAQIAPRPLAAAPSSGFTPVQLYELRISYLRLSEDFYQKIDTQALLDGAYQKLSDDLEHQGIAHAALHKPHAANNDRTDRNAFVDEAESALALGGSKLSSTQIAYDAISGLFGAVKDRYTVFLNPKEYAAMEQGLTGGDGFGGVGLVIGLETTGAKRALVEWVAQGGPADRAGIQSGDVIAAVNGTPTDGLQIKAVSSMLRGDAGTVVRLGIERNGESLGEPLSITRREIHTPSVFAKMLPNKVAFIAITIFGQTTSDELSDALTKFEKNGAQAYILDLRDNGGGYLDSAIDVSSKFIAQGPIVKVTERAGNYKQYDADNDAINPKPLVVLVNGNTASASEITSGAIQDRGVGTLIGTRTFGKGVVQSIYPLPDGSAIKITTARYYTPRGRDINTVGIQPDIVAEENTSPIPGDPSKDAQLQTALTFLSQKVARSASR
jgi:carboxyl-terminal processing protease